MPIVSAVGTIAAVGGTTKVPLAQAIEMAMVKAVQHALDEGVPVSDTEELLRRKQAARQHVLDTMK